MMTLQPTAMTYTVAERAAKIYNTVVDIFDYHGVNDIVTPLGLAKQQLKGLPTGGKLCVPGAGIGTYVLAAIEAGFKPDNIYAVESDKRYYGLGERSFARFGVNYVLADFLTWQPNMKFDVIIGNPPYQDVTNPAKNNKLWMKFVFLSLDLLKEGGYLSFVTPRSVVGRTQVPAKIRKLLSTDYSLLELNHDADTFFNVGVDICSWLAVKRPYDGNTKVTDNNKSRVLDLRQELPLMDDKRLPTAIAEKIHEIVKRPTTKKLNTVSVQVDLLEDLNGIYKVYTSGRNKFYRTNNRLDTEWKIAFSYSATYKQWFVTEADVTGSNRVVYVSSADEGIVIGETLMHPVMSFYLDTWRKTAGFTPAIKNQGCLPDIRGLSDVQVRELFELTDEEYSYIMDNHIPYAKQLVRVI
jgi:hypothetical protein